MSLSEYSALKSRFPHICCDSFNHLYLWAFNNSEKLYLHLTRLIPPCDWSIIIRTDLELLPLFIPPEVNSLGLSRGWSGSVLQVMFPLQRSVLQAHIIPRPSKRLVILQVESGQCFSTLLSHAAKAQEIPSVISHENSRRTLSLSSPQK